MELVTVLSVVLQVFCSPLFKKKNLPFTSALCLGFFLTSLPSSEAGEARTAEWPLCISVCV